VLGTAGDFTILAKSGISTTGTSAIVGDIGVSPIGYESITGFSLVPSVPDVSTTFATSTYVIGKVYAANYAAPTPAKMSTAISDMEAAYTDLAGRAPTHPDNLNGGNLGGQILAPGVYKWTTGVIIPTDVTLSGGANDVWIFQIAGTLGISSAMHVNLIGGAQAKNIYWVVAGTTTLGTNSVFNGNILGAGAVIAIQTGAKLNGRALSAFAVTLDGNTVSLPVAGLILGGQGLGTSFIVHFPEESIHNLTITCMDAFLNTVVDNETFIVDKTPPVLTKVVGAPTVDGSELSADGQGAAAMSTAEAYEGSDSAHLSAPLIGGGPTNEGRIHIPLSGMTLGDINTISWYAKVIDGYIPHVDILIDTNGDGVRDDSLVVEYDKARAPSDQALAAMAFQRNVWVNTFDDKGIVDNTAGVWLSSGAPGPIGGVGFVYGTLAQWKAGTVSLSVNASTKVLALEIEVDGWIAASDSYVDVVKLNNVGMLALHWVKSSTPITFTCTDQQPHPSKGEKVCFKVNYDQPSWPTDVTQSYCNGGTYANGECCVAVNGNNQFVFNFKPGEDSLHSLEYYCKDAVEKRTVTDTQWYKVDNTPPTITKSMIGSEHLGTCPPVLESDVCYVADSGGNGVRVDVTDGGAICAVDQVFCTYEVRWYNNPQAPGTYTVVAGGSFGAAGLGYIFQEDSTHDLVVNCHDALGNAMVEDVETFLVDSTPPVTNKTYGSPFFSEGGYDWITSATPITLTATDNKVGVANVSWKVTLLNVSNDACAAACQFVNGSGMNTVAGNTTQFTIPQTSCHLIEFRSTDLFGYVETTKRQCVFVDNEKPVTTKIIGTPMVNLSGTVYISQQTPITLSCADSLPHPVDQVSLFYRYKFASECSGLAEVPMPGTYTAVQGTTTAITFPEDSCHQMEYYCVDALGNTEATQSEIDIVDTQAPVITTGIEGPQYGTCPQTSPGGSTCFIDGVTNVTVSATDPQPHPVENVTCSWSYTVDGGASIPGGAGLGTAFSVHFPEESNHTLTIQCNDGLNNVANLVRYYSVDKTPPVTTKNFNGPQYPADGDAVGVTHWITSGTNVTLSVSDAGPHKTGINKTYYRVTQLSSNDPCNYTVVPESQFTACDFANGTGSFVEYTGAFHVPQTSCHLIEYYSTDNVQKTELVKRQCVFVDNEYPLTNKTIGDPKTKIYPDTYTWTFYPGTNGKCWTGNESIDCWKVTTMTPVTMACADQQPHPVDHNTVCFKVGFDGDDRTQQYCNEQHGNISGGYCCVAAGDDEAIGISFREESEHNLAYYCVDALGNKGPVDDEKFKVEGDKFTINLTKKWNLISVPFVLQDNVMSNLFDPLASEVVSVWGYDAPTDTWHIYTPDGVANDDLTTMKPGDGYWVLTTGNTTLVIGGSLFSPGLTPPSKTVIHGWNLLGYYGTENQTAYTGPPTPGPGKQAQCELNSISDSVFDKGFTSVWGYWEPYNTDGNPLTPLWLPLGSNSTMAPGAGYWVFATEAGIYAPTTTC
jgi:hypothetical protein